MREHSLTDRGVHKRVGPELKVAYQRGSVVEGLLVEWLLLVVDSREQAGVFEEW